MEPLEPVSVARARAWIVEKGGEIVSGPTRGADGIIRFEVRCAAGHEPWSVRVGNLAYNKSWCAECYGNKPHTIEEMRNLAEGRGGTCLSDVYQGLKGSLRWKCANGHEWEATPNNIMNHGSWCPHCKMNVGEELVRATLEEAFPGETFDRTRQVPWMQGLELDGYNEKLRLAFEYQGRQHYERVGHFQRGEGDFEAQLERDELTADRCESESVLLVVVPYTVQFVDLRAHVRRELVALSYEVAPTVGTDSEFYDRVRSAAPATSERQYKDVVDVIRKKGGECLSLQYVGYRVPLRIRCGAGHEFLATPEAIKQPEYRGPRFCPKCGGTERQTDDVLREKVATCGYEFLGVESITSASGRARRYITVRCPAGHDEYKVMWDNFCPKDGKPKRGCPKCKGVASGRAKRGDISQWVANTGVRPVTQYIGTETACEWTCSRGHTFTAKLTALRQKVEGACTECCLLDYADNNGLELLTPWNARFGASTPLIWRCLVCDSRFDMSRMSMGRKKKACATCA